jgi:hypothetical protein
MKAKGISFVIPMHSRSLRPSSNMDFSKLARSFALLLLLAGCSNSPKETYDLFINDMEMNRAWINEGTTQKTDQAYSGSFVSVIDNNSPYGIGYREVIDNFPHPFNAVEIKCMVRGSENKSHFCVALGIDSLGTPKYWKGETVDSLVVKDEWQEVKVRFVIPPNTSPKNTLSVYVMTDDKNKIMVDDFQVKTFLQ